MEKEELNLKDPRVEKLLFLNNILEKATKAIQTNDDDSLKDCYNQYKIFIYSFKMISQLEKYTFERAIKYKSFKEDFLTDIKGNINVCRMESPKKSSNITICNNNSQSQNQQLNVNLKEELRKSLTGKQYDEIIRMMKTKSERENIKDKLISYGIDLCAQVLARILTSYA